MPSFPLHDLSDFVVDLPQEELFGLTATLPLTVPDGGTGAGYFSDGYVILGSGVNPLRSSTLLQDTGNTLNMRPEVDGTVLDIKSIAAGGASVFTINSTNADTVLTDATPNDRVGLSPRGGEVSVYGHEVSVMGHRPVDGTSAHEVASLAGEVRDRQGVGADNSIFTGAFGIVFDDGTATGNRKAYIGHHALLSASNLTQLANLIGFRAQLSGSKADKAASYFAIYPNNGATARAALYVSEATDAFLENLPAGNWGIYFAPTAYPSYFGSSVAVGTNVNIAAATGVSRAVAFASKRQRFDTIAGGANDLTVTGGFVMAVTSPAPWTLRRVTLPDNNEDLEFEMYQISGDPMTISHLAGAGTGLQIYCPTGADVVVATGGWAKFKNFASAGYVQLVTWRT